MLSNYANLRKRSDLLKALTHSQLKAQAAGTYLGYLWWLVDPLVMMGIYYVVMVEILNRGANYQPYAVFILCGLLPWKHLTTSIGKSSGVLRSSEGLIKAIPFPTMVLPLSRVLSCMVYFLAGLVVLLLAALFCGRPIGFSMLQLLPLLALQLIIVTGLSITAAALGARWRDFGIVVGHLLRIGFYGSPVIYGMDLVTNNLGANAALLYRLNPFALLIGGYRQCFFYGGYLPANDWYMLIAQALVIAVIGYQTYQYFDRRVIKFL